MPMDSKTTTDGTREGVPASLTPAERDCPLALADQPRDRAILALFCHAGLERTELQRLDRGDVDLSRGWVTIRHGGEGKARRLPLNPVATAVLRHYLTTRPDDEPPLFLSRRRQRIGARTLTHIVRKDTRQLGLDRPVPPQSLRAACLTTLYRDSGDPAQVQRTAGHRHRRTTAKYCAPATAGTGDGGTTE